MEFSLGQAFNAAVATGCGALTVGALNMDKPEAAIILGVAAMLNVVLAGLSGRSPA